MTVKTAVTQMLAEYYSAFSTLNIQAILPYFHQPALFIGPPGVFAVPTFEALTAILVPTMEDLRARDYRRSELSLQQVSSLSSTTALARGVAVRCKADGHELERVGITYLLHKAETGWKIAVIVFSDSDAVV